MSDTQGTQGKQFDLQGWTRTVVGAITIVVSSWQLFTNDIHGYIDTKSDDIARNVTNEVTGNVLLVMDSLRAELKRDCHCPPKDEQERGRSRRR